MGLFSRKEERPRIPVSPTLPEIPEKEVPAKRSTSELPSIPSNSTSDNLNEEMIKSAMDDGPKDDDLSPMEKEVIPEEPAPSHMRARSIPTPPAFKSEAMPAAPVEGQPRRETIFVKIDHFNNAQDTLGEIEEQMKELASDINKLKEVKIKEVEELNAWDEELKAINTRLSNVDSKIFGEV